MTDTIDDVAAEAAGQEPVEPAFDEQSVAEQLVAQAREKGIELVGPSGLLSQLTKRVLEAALEAEMSEIWATTSSARLPAPGGQPSRMDHLCRLTAVRRSSRRTRSQDRDGATTCGTCRAPTG